MHRDPQITERRVLMAQLRWVNPNCWSLKAPFEVEAWEVPGDGSGRPGEPVPVTEALAAEFTPTGPGQPWGPPWGTTWFRLRGTVPPEMEGRPVEAILDLGFDWTGPGFQAEGMVWRQSADGSWSAERGLHPRNHRFRIADKAVAGEQVELLVEAASNPSLIAGLPDPNHDVLTAPRDPRYVLGELALGVIELDVWHLHHDLNIVNGLYRNLPEADVRRIEILAALDSAIDCLDPADVPGTAAAAREALAPILERRAASSAHKITAVGHAHIDTAWLWPIRETKRKCARTFSNVLRLMEEEPDLVFACSQAQQYEWIREEHPEIFEGIRQRTAEGRWVPVGGMWVEADGNVPGGEAMLRQLLVGQRWFREHLGVTCTEVWIPDVFGYPAGMPQIYRHGGCERFLTQKLSWNRTNRFPHHTFWWEGLDGSRVYTHFPPVETYNATFDPSELAHAVKTFTDHGASTRSLMPFGYGDGGGGPTRDMLEQYRRTRDLDGLPKVEMGSPEQFFDDVIAEHPDPPVWVGELYFEMHRGTYTSQARTKVGNRRNERNLREAELWSVLATTLGIGDYPAERLADLWRTVLTLQFHDILPGSSIGWVHREAEATHAEVEAELDEIVGAALTAVAERAGTAVVANAAPHDRDEVVVLDALPDGVDPQHVQALSDGRTAVRVAVPALGAAALEPLVAEQPATARATDEGAVLDNGLVRVEVGPAGEVTSLVHAATGRDAIAPGQAGNRWIIHRDHPIEYDAWDIEEYDRRSPRHLDEVESVEVVETGPLVASVRVVRRFDSSRTTETITLRAGSERVDVSVDLDWQERHRLLKVEWPVDVLTTEVVRHVQFGHHSTPVHRNTSWDQARFELCAHHWIDVGEAGFGVSLLNDGRYGHDVSRDRDETGRAFTTMRLTVAKGADYPDPEADRGRHTFTYAVLPHAGDVVSAGVVAEGYRLNTPVRVAGPAATSGRAGSGAVPAPIVTVDHPAVVVEAVKLAEDGSGDVIVRCYESSGGRAEATLTAAVPFGAARLTDALEDGQPPQPAPELDVAGRSLHLRLSPFQIATVRLSTQDAT